MKVHSIIEMFTRLLKNLGVRFINFVGDGGSKTYSGIAVAAPYSKTTVNKKECIGHVRKWMGTRLRRYKKRNKGRDGKGELTGKVIDKLAVYYGKAIRDNSDSVENMKNHIWKSCQSKCPTEADSWYGYHNAQKKFSYVSYYQALTADVPDTIKSIYEDLTKDELLKII